MKARRNGSTEVSWLTVEPGNYTIDAWTSVPEGVVTIAERFGGTDVTPECFAAMRGHVRPMLRDFASRVSEIDERTVREVAAHVRQPVIFPCSNPRTYSEAKPDDLYAWTDCRCLVATGSPFRDVDCGGRRWRVGQGNNVFIFPGLGLGALAVQARKVTNAMTNAASKTLAAQVTAEELAQGLLFPSVSRLPVVSFEVAVAVARQAVRDGVAEHPVEDIERHIAQAIWEPDYPEYEPAP